MYGLQAIYAANGWMITIAGISIVFSGLVVLSTLISLMPRALAWWDRRVEMRREARQAVPSISTPAEPERVEPPAPPARPGTIRLSTEQMEAADYLRTITDRLGTLFSLQRLLEVAERHGVARPYYHLKEFLDMKLIVEESGENRGFYKWNTELQIEDREPASN